MKKIITAKPTRKAAREFIAKAKAEGVTLLAAPFKAYGLWWVETKERQVLSLKR